MKQQTSTTPEVAGERALTNLVEGVHRFQSDVLPGKRELFEKLAHGQWPDTLWITCSDSRIDPNLLTQSGPGDLFVYRNPGALAPPYTSASSSAAATVEYAIGVLGVSHIVVCGHTDCGAMKALLAPELLSALPAVASWLAHAQPGLQALPAASEHTNDQDRLRALTEANVVAQLENLATYPCVTEAITAGRVQLHGWVYDIETGGVAQHHAKDGVFVALDAGRDDSEVAAV